MMVFLLVRPDKGAFTQLEYVESSGTQYIDTGFKPNNNTRVIMDVKCNVSGTFPVFGSREDLTSKSFTFWMFMPQAPFRSDYGGAQDNMEVTDVLSRMTIDKNKNVCQCAGVTTTSDNATFESPSNLLLFGVNTNGEIDERMLSGRLYSCKIYDNGTLIRSYIPAKDTSGVACLYDKVNGKFVYSSGTSQFVAGPEI